MHACHHRIELGGASGSALAAATECRVQASWPSGRTSRRTGRRRPGVGSCARRSAPAWTRPVRPRSRPVARRARSVRSARCSCYQTAAYLDTCSTARKGPYYSGGAGPPGRAPQPTRRVAGPAHAKNDKKRPGALAKKRTRVFAIGVCVNATRPHQLVFFSHPTPNGPPDVSRRHSLQPASS